MPGTFDEGQHPRDEGGKFGSGSGGGSGGKQRSPERQDRIAGAKKAASDRVIREAKAAVYTEHGYHAMYAEARPTSVPAEIHAKAEEAANHPDVKAKAEAAGRKNEQLQSRAEDADQAEDDNMNRAIEAGHVDASLIDELKTVEAAHNQAQENIAKIGSDLDSAQAEAMKAAHDFDHLDNAMYQNEMTDDLVGANDGASEYVDAVQALGVESGDEYDDVIERSDVIGPDQNDPGREAWEKELGAKHKAAAIAVQESLQKLHAQQIAAMTEVKNGNATKAMSALEKKADRADPDDMIKEAFSSHARDEDGNIIDPTHRDAEDSAHDAADTIKATIEGKIWEMNSEVVDAKESGAALRRAAAATASTIKELAKITGKPAKLAKAPVKAKTATKAKKEESDDDDE